MDLYTNSRIIPQKRTNILIFSKFICWTAQNILSSSVMFTVSVELLPNMHLLWIYWYIEFRNLISKCLRSSIFVTPDWPSWAKKIWVFVSTWIGGSRECQDLRVGNWGKKSPKRGKANSIQITARKTALIYPWIHWHLRFQLSLLAHLQFPDKCADLNVIIIQLELFLRFLIWFLTQKTHSKSFKCGHWKTNTLQTLF